MLFGGESSMNKIEIIDSDNFHDVTIQILNKTQFENSSIDTLIKEYTENYILVYNKLVEKFYPEEDSTPIDPTDYVFIP